MPDAVLVDVGLVDVALRAPVSPARPGRDGDGAPADRAASAGPEGGSRGGSGDRAGGAAGRHRPGGLRPLLPPALAYLASRVVNLVGVAVAARVSGRTFSGEVRLWDSAWFLKAATAGWPHHLPRHHGHVLSSTIAFFPLFPLSVRGTSAATGLSPAVAGMAISLACGLSATLAVWALVRHYSGPRAANRAAAAFAFFPGTFVFGMIYSDGMVLTLAALALLLLLRKRWVAAGLVGALATASAPGALMLVPAAAWMALGALRRRQWAALWAPALTPAGFLAYQLWVFGVTGHVNAWTLTERGGWHSYVLLKYPVVVVERFLAAPFAHLKVTEVFLGALFAAVALVLLARHRPPGPVLVFAVASITLALVTTPIGARPRFILGAFPLVTVWGAALRRYAFALFILLSAAGLGALTVFSLTSWVLVP